MEFEELYRPKEFIAWNLVKNEMNTNLSILKKKYTSEPYHSFLRPAAAVLVRFLKNTPVTSNQVTLISAITGVFSGILTGYRYPVLGGILLFLSMILDCADGQLARAKGEAGTLGRILDGAADYTTAIFVHIGIAVYLSAYISPVWPWIGATAVSMAGHCIYFDSKKQWFLSRIDPNYSEINSKREADRYLKHTVNFPSRVFMKIYRYYLSFQSGIAGTSADNYFISEPSRRNEFINRAGPFMGFARLLGPAGHNFFIVIFMFLSSVIYNALFFYLLLVTVVFNILFILTLSREYRLNKYLKNNQLI